MYVYTSKKLESYKVVHIIEHEGYGTLHQLIEPLQKDCEQKVIRTYNVSEMQFVLERILYVIHTTGHLYPLISNLNMLLDNKVNIVVFLHVAPKYFEFKNKMSFLKYLRCMQKEYDLKCYCPSNELALQYGRIGLNVNSIQIGFPQIVTTAVSNAKALNKYCHKYVTVCTSSDSRYIDLKGINEFVDVIEKNCKKSEALILGFDGNYRGIESKRLELADFLYVLKNSCIFSYLRLRLII